MKPTSKAGIMAALIIVLVNIIIWLAKWHETDGASLTLIGTVAFIFFIYRGMSEKRDLELGGIFNYNQAFSAGMGVVFWASLVTGVLMFAIYKFLDQDYILLFKQKMLEVIADFPTDQRAQMEEMIPKIATPGMVAFGDFISRIIWGLIFTLIMAAVVKKDNSDKINSPEVES